MDIFDLQARYNVQKPKATIIMRLAQVAETLRPDIVDALRTAVQREHRSIANIVKVLVRDYCGRYCSQIAKGTVDDNNKTSKRK